MLIPAPCRWQGLERSMHMAALEQSKTRINLMRAFAGESQARNRYAFAAQLARGQRLEVVAEAFDLTARQEQEHAEIFYGFLAPLNGTNILMDAGYPVNTERSVAAQLRDARHNEMEECDVVYPDFARMAREEGLGRIADVFSGVAEIERTHAARFQRFADALEAGKLFAGGSKTAWLCLNCGHIHLGSEAPAVCPICGRDQGWMIRADWTPLAP